MYIAYSIEYIVYILRMLVLSTSSIEYIFGNMVSISFLDLYIESTLGSLVPVSKHLFLIHTDPLCVSVCLCEIRNNKKYDLEGC